MDQAKIVKNSDNLTGNFFNGSKSEVFGWINPIIKAQLDCLR
jgi:hypothetical protein